MRRGGFNQAGITHGLLHGALHALLIQVMAARLAGTRIDRQILRRKNILPAPLAPRIGVFFIQRKRQIHLTIALRQILLVQGFNL